jgi:hypothetical protein
MSHGMRRLRVLAVVAASALPATAWTAPPSQPPVFHDASVKPSPLPARFVAPEYPAQALASGLTGDVVVEATLRTDGRLASPRYFVDSEASRAFVPPVEKVIGDWRFERDIGPDCMPTEAPIRARVHFGIEAGEPKVSAIRAEPQSPRPKPAPAAKKRVRVGYPQGMAERELQADIYARLEIDERGTVTHVATAAYPRTGGERLAAFEGAVRDAALDWVYPARAEVWHSCVVFRFRMRN